MTKVLFLALIGLIGTIATVRTTSLFKYEWAKPFKVTLVGSGVLVALVLLETIVGVLHRADLSDIVRDSVTYIIVAAAVPIGLDAASKMSLRIAITITMGITCFAGISLMVSVLAARGVSSLSLTRVGLPSLMALAVGVSLCLVKALDSRRRAWVWLLLAAVQIVFVLATGSRAGLVLLATGVVGISFVARGRVGLFRFLGSVVAFGGALVLTFNFIVAQVTTSAFIDSRIQASLQFLQQGSADDQSGIIRARATTYATNAWDGNMLVGVGFGHIFPDPNPGGGTAHYQLDTSALYLAKFGLIGSAVLLGAIALMLIPAFKRIADNSNFPEQTVAIGACSVWLVQLYFGSPTEDKGFSLAIMMIELLMAAAARQHSLQISPRWEDPLLTRGNQERAVGATPDDHSEPSRHACEPGTGSRTHVHQAHLA